MTQPMPFLPISGAARIRTEVERLQGQGYSAPLCPWCTHWGTVGYAWTCDFWAHGDKPTSDHTGNVYECAGYTPQMELFGSQA